MLKLELYKETCINTWGFKISWTHCTADYDLVEPSLQGTSGSRETNVDLRCFLSVIPEQVESTVWTTATTDRGNDQSETTPLRPLLWKQEETLAKWSLRRSFSVLRSADQTAGARRSKIKQHKKNKTLQKKKKKRFKVPGFLWWGKEEKSLHSKGLSHYSRACKEGAANWSMNLYLQLQHKNRVLRNLV